MADVGGKRFNGPVPIIAFTSGKGGCGKTTISVNFANVVANAGQKVLLVDFDLANRGSTGLLSKWVKTPAKRVTATTLLRDDTDVTGPLLQIKPNLFFIPATGPDEAGWKDDRIPLDALIRQLQKNLQAVAKKNQIGCVVLDCFCGIDLLTTAAAGLADDTVIVNEPDIVTFNGSLALLTHLKTSWDQLEHKPRLHLVINRMRSNFSVRDLTALYRDNLQQAVSEIVLCHFPYHPRIFDTFGKYPFISDLLPRSLFVRKLELLTYLLYRGYADQLLKPRVLNWSRRKIKKIYEKSIDSTAVDSQYLVSKFTGFPLLVGVWLLVTYVAFRTFPLRPTAAWWLSIISVTALSVITYTSLIQGCWLAARMNLALAAFRFRLAQTQETSLLRLQYDAGALAPLFSGTLMTLSSLFFVGVFAWGIALFMDIAFNLGFKEEADVSFETRQFNIAVSSPARVLDLRHLTLSKLSGYNVDWDAKEWGPFPLEKSTLIEDTVFRNCTFATNGLSAESLENVSFLGGGFEGSRNYDSPSTVTNVFLRHVKLVDCALPPLLHFSRSNLSDVSIELPAGPESDVQFISFDRCSLHRLFIKRKGGGKIYLTSTHAGLNRPAVSVEGEYQWISKEAYQRLVMNSSFNFYYEQVKKKLLETKKEERDKYLNALCVMVQYYILSSDPLQLEDAEKAANDALELAKELGDQKLIGLAHAQLLVLAIVDAASPNVVETRLSRWTEWLRKNPPNPKVKGVWPSDRWKKYLSRLNLDSLQTEKLNAVAASGSGEMSPDLLGRTFEKSLNPSHTAAERNHSDHGAIESLVPSPK